MPQYNYPEDFEGTFWTVIDGDYYVSTIGNDITGDGSPKNPFLTIGKAFELAQDGEKVIIGPDEYISFDPVGADQSGAEPPCRLASISNISISSGGMVTMDGVLTSEGDRVLLWNQANAVENGIYIASSGSWSRADNFDNAGNIINGKLVPVLEGNQYAKTIFQHTTQGAITVGTTALTFEKAAITDWGELQGDIEEQGDLTTKINDHITVAVDILKDGVPSDRDTLNKLYQLIQGVVGVSAAASDIADRDSQQNSLEDQQNIYVADASADSSVTSGWAIYKYIEATDSFVKIAEQESIDVQIFSLGNGNGTTANGNTVDLGGNLSADVSINGYFGPPGPNYALNLTVDAYTLYSVGDNDLRISKANETGNLILENTSGGDLDLINNSNGTLRVSSNGGPMEIRGTEDVSIAAAGGDTLTLSSVVFSITMDNSAALLIDGRGSNAVGLQYAEDYTSNFTARSLVDKGYVDQEIAAVQPKEIEKYYVSPDLDNVVIAKYTTPVQLSIKFFNGVTAATYRSKLDDGLDTYTDHANLAALNAYLGGLSDGVDVDLEITTNPTEYTVIKLTVDRS